MSSLSTGRAPSRVPAPASPGLFSFRLHDVHGGSALWQEPLCLSIGRERLGIVGRNGVGKSLLVHILAGRTPSSGKAERTGRVHLVAPPMLPQDHRSVAQAMGLGEVLAAAERLADGLATPDDPVAGLSAGERMRVALAGAVAADADSIILDEPGNHLDLDTTLTLHGALLAASHDEEFIAALRPTHRWQWQGGRLQMREWPAP